MCDVAEKFRSDLMNIAMTTLSLKILSQDKEHFAKLFVDAVMRLMVRISFTFSRSSITQAESRMYLVCYYFTSDLRFICHLIFLYFYQVSYAAVIKRLDNLIMTF